VVPLGAFLVLHLFTNAQALLGRARFEDAVVESNALPFATPLEVIFIFLPLLFHAGYGIRLALRAKSDLKNYPHGKHWGYVMQRATGVVALAFIVWHLYQYRWQRFGGKLAEMDFHGELCASLSSTQSGVPWTALAYLIGTAAVIFHFSNGLYGFFFSFGITTTREGTRVTSATFGMIGALLFAVAASTIIFFATGSRLLLAAPESGLSSSAPRCRELDEPEKSRAPAEAPVPTAEAISPEPALPPEPRLSADFAFPTEPSLTLPMPSLQGAP
jgi:succinate dehydrogenase / fumarate reductase, cytochrome b subunit